MAQVRDIATMSVYEYHRQRTEGPVDSQHASVAESLNVFSRLLQRLQEQGVEPGTRLLITIEKV